MNLQIATMRCQCGLTRTNQPKILHTPPQQSLFHPTPLTQHQRWWWQWWQSTWVLVVQVWTERQISAQRQAWKIYTWLRRIKVKTEGGRVMCWTTIKGTHYKRTMWLFSKTGWKGQCQDWWQLHTDRLCIYMERTWDGQLRRGCWQVKARLTNNFWPRDVSWVWTLEEQPKWGRQM